MKTVYNTSQGQAWDQVAKEKSGSEKAMGQLLPVNRNEMDALLFAGEIELAVPQIQAQPVRSLPPWERM